MTGVSVHGLRASHGGNPLVGHRAIEERRFMCRSHGLIASLVSLPMLTDDVRSHADQVDLLQAP